MVAASAAGSCDGHEAKRGNEPGWPSWCPASPQECRIRNHGGSGGAQSPRFPPAPHQRPTPDRTARPPNLRRQHPHLQAPRWAARGTRLGGTKNLSRDHPATFCRGVVYHIDVSGHQHLRCASHTLRPDPQSEDASLLVLGERAAEVIGVPAACRIPYPVACEEGRVASGPGGGPLSPGWAGLPAWISPVPGPNARSNTLFRSNVDAWPTSTLPTAVQL